MRVIRNRYIPFKGFKAINLLGVVFVREEAEMTDADFNHEAIHTAQMRELGYIGFYLCYLVEWLWRMSEGRSSQRAYHAISFEKEAYAHEEEPDYLASRKPFAQWE